MARLKFNAQTTRKQPIRTAPSKFLTSKLRGIFERSEGVRLSESFYPYRYLPVCFQDTETEDWVVIPKGRIVSVLTMHPRYATTAAAWGVTPVSGVREPYASGILYTFDDATTTATDYTKITYDTSYWGYREHVAGVLLPANDVASGLGTANYAYSANDVTAGTLTVSGTIAKSGGPLILPAAHPVGVVMADVYQDIRGNYLNYQLWDDVTILTDWYVEIPFVNTTKFDAAGFATAGTFADTSNLENTANVYEAVYRKHSFLYFTDESVVPGPHKAAICGAHVGPDKYGNYKVLHMGGGAATESFTDFINAQIATKSVGKIIVLDSRWPKDQLELVDTYPGSTMPGTDTGGIPRNLYSFAYDCLLDAYGVAPTITQLVTWVQQGMFGVSRVNLHVS